MLLVIMTPILQLSGFNLAVFIGKDLNIYVNFLKVRGEAILSTRLLGLRPSFASIAHQK
jgi:hypothetical protein